MLGRRTPGDPLAGRWREGKMRKERWETHRQACVSASVSATLAAGALSPVACVCKPEACRGGTPRCRWGLTDLPGKVGTQGAGGVLPAFQRAPIGERQAGARRDPVPAAPGDPTLTASVLAPGPTGSPKGWRQVALRPRMRPRRGPGDGKSWISSPCRTSVSRASCLFTRLP